MNPLAPVQVTDDSQSDNPFVAQSPTLADGWQANSRAYADWVAQQRADGVARGLIDPQTGWPTGVALIDAAHQFGSALIGGTAAPEGGSALTSGFTAYHGSPHSFDQFRTSAIGTGEGAQAYGHGLYFADREGVARGYRDALSGGMSPDNAAAYRAASDAHADASKEAEGIQDLMVYHSLNKGMPPDDGWGTLGMEHHPDVIKLFKPKLDAILARQADAKSSMDAALAAPRDPGNMYEVKIGSDPSHFLDWDKPLAEQSPHVKAALSSIPWAEPYLKTNLTGGQIAPRTAEAAQQFHSAGIPGIRYLDGGSRADGTGTSNHVVFDPATISILRKYGIAGLTAGAAASVAGNSQQ